MTDHASHSRPNASRTDGGAADRAASDAARRGRASHVWRAGQTRRLALIAAHAAVAGARVLDLGCGVGLYTNRMAEVGANAIGTEIELDRAREARRRGLTVAANVGEALPFADRTFDTVLLHEVLEHVADDRATVRETVRVLVPGGRAVIFVPNRLWPFETHGVYWRGEYRFGNAPLVNYLPDPLRERLAPHVRVYTAGGLRRLFEGLPVAIVHHTQMFPGFDRLALRQPGLAGLLRAASDVLARTPARRFGLSHVVVVEREGATEARSDALSGRPYSGTDGGDRSRSYSSSFFRSGW